MTDIFLIAAGLVVFVLAALALFLHWRLYQVRKSQRLAQAHADQKRVAQKQRINSSIQVIAHALASQQVGATEASIRISVLLDALEVEQSVKEEFGAFYNLAQDASHIPILDAWKALPKQKRRTYELELTALEEKHQNSVADAASRIRGREF